MEYSRIVRDALLSLALICALGFAWQARHWPQAISLILIHVDRAVGETAQAMEKLNTAADQSTQASKEAVTLIQTANDRVNQMGTVLSSANETIQQTKVTIASIQTDASGVSADSQKAIQNLSTVAVNLSTAVQDASLALGDTRSTLNDLDALLKDHAISDTISHLDETSLNFAEMSRDAQYRFHLLMFPPHTPWYTRMRIETVNGARVLYDLTHLAP